MKLHLKYFLFFVVLVILLSCVSIIYTKITIQIKYDLIIENATFLYETTPPNIIDTTKFDKKFTSPNCSTFDIVGPFLSMHEYHSYYFTHKEFTEKYSLLHLKNTYVLSQCIFYSKNTFYIPRRACQNEFHPKFPLSVKVKNITGITISICHAWSSKYAHMIFDVLPPLTLLPESVLTTSTFLVNESFPFVFDLLGCFQIQHSQICEIGKETFFYCESIITLNPHPFYQIHGTLLTQLRDHFVKLFELDKTSAFRFVVFNRQKTRMIRNFGEMYYEILIRFPQFPWEMRKPLIGFKVSALFYNEIKFLLGPHGADFANTLFMQKNSIVCEMQADLFVSCYFYFSNFLGFHHVVMRIPHMGIQLLSQNLAPIPIIIEMIEKGLSYL
ncbi:hypothetical protein TRFO_35525 [Tritrichomonas foetus]|uniref:Glycosyltransferase 61 catalytic domain-containing protein n=1 Tax=Tritrichomonas foetus TaxID=1144522 RepID=A0A1J4JKL4_9EUKA|nr:hypothetical protein TRFO_35525 [Tritrichomonas foetus]|eukprot:OHS98107.1 hypothetical protein TRFO_35525 [Tritrichomonas foetus]